MVLRAGDLKEKEKAPTRQNEAASLMTLVRRRYAEARIKDLTAQIPSIRDKTTVVAAVIPDLTLIKVIIVFLSVVPNPPNQTNL